MRLGLSRRKAIVYTAVVAAGFSLDKAAAQDSPHPFLIRIPDLLERLTDGTVRVRLLDASPLRTWRSGHIPAATHVFWQDTVDANYPVYGAVVTQGFEQQQRLEVVRRFGVEPADAIVVYDDVGGFRAARIVWFLRLLGFSEVALLDGGLEGWRKAGGEVEHGSRSAPEVEPVVEPQDGFYVVTEALTARIERGDTDVIDIRSSGEARDTLDGQLPVGAIPSSQSWPWTDVIDPATNTPQPVETLRSQIEPLGLTENRDIVVYGRFGAETALSWIVLKELGFDRVLTYDRGWVEWASTDGLEIVPLP